MTITGLDETPVLPNIPVKVEYDFTEANFDCTMTDTRTSLGESVAGKFEITCNNAPFGDEQKRKKRSIDLVGGRGTYGGVAIVGGTTDDVNTDKFITTPTNFYYKTTVTAKDGTVKIINKSELGAVLFPKNDGNSCFQNFPRQNLFEIYCNF